MAQVILPSPSSCGLFETEHGACLHDLLRVEQESFHQRQSVDHSSSRELSAGELG
jgi:hypothetical protein